MKLRNVLFALLTGLTAVSATAIPIELWEETYATDGHQAKAMDLAIFDNDEAVHAVAIAGAGITGPSLRLDRIDGDGNLISQTTVATADSGLIMNVRLMPLHDGGVIVTYTKNWKPEWYDTTGTPQHNLCVARVAANGDILWNDETFGFSRIEKQVREVGLLTNTIYFGGWWGASSQANGGRTAHLTSYDLDGNHLATVLVDEPQEISRVADIEFTGDAAFLTGSLVNGGEFLTRVNYDGEIEWSLPSEMDLITEMTIGFDGYIYLTGMNSNQNYLVASATQAGSYNWQRIFEEGVPNPPSQAILQILDGRLVVWKNNLQLVLISSDGTRLYEGGQYGEPDDWDGNAIGMYEDGDLLLSSSGIADSVLLTRVTDGTNDVGEAGNAARVTEFELAPAHPNPFNAMTTLQLAVPSAGQVQVSVMDILGRTVDAWSLNAPAAGTYELSWSANGFASGLYFVRALSPAGAVSTQKIVLLR